MPARSVWERLVSGASDRTLPQSLILIHPDPERGSDLARELARLYLCTEDRETGCVCADCRLLAAGNHPDLRVVAPEGKMHYKVEQIRDLRADAQKPPFMGAGKFFVLHSAHKLNPASANALLKILEEPSPSTHFLLITSQPFLLLPTIRSRCFSVALPRSEESAGPPEDLLRLWERWKSEGTEAARMQFLKRLSLEEYGRIPCVLMGLWRLDPHPALASLARGYLRVLASTPPTFNRQQALESLDAFGGPARPLSLSSD